MPDHHRMKRHPADVGSVKKVVCGHRSISLDAVGQVLGILHHIDIHQELWLWPEVGMGWGRHWPREACTLALALLHRAIAPDRLGVCDEWHVPLACDPWAYRLAWRLAEDILMSQDTWTFRVELRSVAAWASTEQARWAGPSVDLDRLTPAERFPAALYP